MKIKLSKFALRISLIYAVIGSVWILLSGRVLFDLVSDPGVRVKLEIYKGWAFVVVTALLLYLLLRGQLGRWENEALERKRAEEALHNNDRFLKLVMDLVPHFIFVKDRKSRHLLVNRACAEASNRTPEEMVGLSDLDLSSNRAQAESFMKDDQEVIATGQPKFVSEDKLTDATGKTRVFQTTKIPFPASMLSSTAAGNGEPAILGVAVDITARKEAEDALHQKEAQLVEALQVASQFQFSIDQASDAIFWMTRDAGLTYVNEQACRSLGYTREELMRLHLWDFDPVFPKERWDADWKQFQQDKQGGTQQMETFHRRKDGSVFPVSISSKHLWFGDTELHVAGARDISEHRQAEEKLLYEQELFLSLLETTPDNVYFKDRESRIVRVSRSKMQGTLQTARDHYRATHPEAAPDQWPPHLAGPEPFGKWLIGKTDFDTYPEAHARAAYEDEQEIIRTGRPLAAKLEKATLPDGKIVWWLTTKMPWRDKDGNIIGTYGVSANVTEFKEVEAALNQERLLLRTLIDLLPEIFYIKDLNSRFLVANQTMSKHFGKNNPAEVLGRSDADFFPPAMAAGFRAEEDKVLAGESLIDHEQHVNFPDGRKCTLLTTKVPFRDGDGKICGLVGIGRDITDRKRAEEELRHVNRSLQTLSKCNETLVRAADEASLLTQICQIVTNIGGYSLAWVGYAEPDEAKSVRTAAWGGSEPGYLEKLRVTWMDTEPGRGPAGIAIRTGQPAIFSNLAEHPNFGPWRKEALRRGFTACIGLPLKTDDKAFGVLCVYSSQPDAFNATETELLTELANDLAFGIVTLRYRAERKQLEEQLRQSQKMDAIGQLASGVAHDFNNMLTVIQGNASLLSNPQLGAGERMEAAQQIVRAAERAASLTRQLLLFSRKQVIEAVPLNVNEVVGNMTKMLQRILGEDVSLNANYGPNLPVIFADPGMIEQVLLNLAVNSRDAMPNGGRLTITTSAETLDKQQAEKNVGASPGVYACLNVTDNGSGIAPENLPHIFEPFFTTKEVGKGTGLGLATVYGIVQQHHGWIAVNSQMGQGTSFRIYLPATKDALPKSPAAAAVSKLPGGNETILLVEDEAPVRLLAGNLLRRCGYTILVAESGVVALAMWKEHREKIHLLLTDMVMPDGISGRELAEKLKSDRPELKVIYTSGYSADIIGREPKWIEGSNFLQKPYHPLKLAQIVRNCLDRKPAPE
ncbi:MAG: PAS domain-containing protein [Verrucomicrobiia bacterium]